MEPTTPHDRTPPDATDPRVESSASGPGPTDSSVEAGPAPGRYPLAWLVLDATVLTLLAAAVYWSLRQHSWYLVDGQTFVHSALLGEWAHPYHTFYMPLLGAFMRLWTDAGSTPYEGAVSLSAFGGAVGVGLSLVVIARLGFARGQALLLGLCVAVCPAIAFFSTVVEVHGLFVVFLAIALWTMVEHVRRPSVWTLLLAGFGIGVAFVAHPTGGLIGCLFPVLWWIGRESTGLVARGRGFFQALVGFAAVGPVLGAMIFVLPPLAGLLGLPQTKLDKVVGMTSGWEGHENGLYRWSELFATEWLIPFAPFTVLALATLVLVPAVRFSVLWLLAAVLAYVLASAQVLPNYSEHGAYFLPLVLPTIVVTLPLLARHRWLALATPIVSAIGGFVWIKGHDDPVPLREMVAGMREIAGDRMLVVLMGEEMEIGALLMHEVHDYGPGADPDDMQRLRYLGNYLADSPETVRKEFALVDRHLDTFCLLISKETVDRLRDSLTTGRFVQSRHPKVWLGRKTTIVDGVEQADNGLLVSEEFVLDWLENHWQMEPVKARGFEGFRLRDR
jgi:MFS family permease